MQKKFTLIQFLQIAVIGLLVFSMAFLTATPSSAIDETPTPSATLNAGEETLESAYKTAFAAYTQTAAMGAIITSIVKTIDAGQTQTAAAYTPTATPTPTVTSTKTATPTNTAIPIPSPFPWPVGSDFSSEQRAYLLRIAERYEKYQWRAINTTWTFWDVDHLNNPMWSFNDWHTSIGVLHGDKIDTPNCNKFPEVWGCWNVGGQINVGVPYFWGGTTPIEDDHNSSDGLNDHMWDINLQPGLDVSSGLSYFGDKIAAGKPAGSIKIDALADGANRNGVDCTGFVSQVWGSGWNHTRFGMGFYNQTRPIRFKDLRAGDVLVYPVEGNGHIILFAGWANGYTPGSEEPPVGTELWAYEASQSAGKVIRSRWQLKQLDFKNGIGYGGSKSYADTDLATLQRVEACSWDDCITGLPVSQTVTYMPHTKFTPIDIQLVIDVSGSMTAEQQAYARESARQILDTLIPGDKFGIETFGATGHYLLPMTTIVDPAMDHGVPGIDTRNGQGLSIATIKSQYLTAPFPPDPEGTTSIGTALKMAIDHLTTYGIGAPHYSTVTDPQKMIILLSDGQENTKRFLDYALYEEARRKYIKIYPVQTTSANSSKMHEIADKTYGIFSPSISTVVELLLARFDNSSLIKLQDGTLNNPPQNMGIQNTEPELPFFTVDPSMAEINFAFISHGNPLNLILERPDGSMVDPASNDPSMTIRSGNKYIYYTIRGPQRGKWRLHISGTNGDTYSFSVSSVNGMILSADLDREDYFPDEPINFTVHLEDSVSANLSATPEYIRGMTVNVTAEDPEHNSYTFALFDDGLHNDGATGDGIYGGAFSDTSIKGFYDFNIQISGKTNRDNTADFSRQKSISVGVGVYPVVTKLDDTNDGQCTRTDCSLREAIEMAAPNAIITFAPELAGQTIYLNSSLTLSKNVTIDASELTNPIIISGDSGNNGSIDVAAFIVGTASSPVTATLNHLTITKSKRGVYVSFQNALRVTDSTFSDNVGGSGAGIWNDFGDVSIAGSIFSGNKATYTSNSYGGAIYNELGTLEVIDSNFLGNTATASGGAIANSYILTVSNSTFSNNVAAKGGAIAAYGSLSNSELTVISSTFSHNTATLVGGGIMHYADLASQIFVVKNSTFSNNTAPDGGGIYNTSYGSNPLMNVSSVTNSTLFGNSATGSGTSGYGGGIYSSSGSLVLKNATFSNNSAITSGGGIYNTGKLDYANTIVANSLLGGDCVSNALYFTQNLNNLVKDGSCSTNAVNFKVGDPQILSLADNGGLTQTMALLSSSPALDAGNNTVCAAAPINNLDQRGISRPQGAVCDIGAYERVDGPDPTLTPSLTPTITITPTFTATQTSTKTATPVWTHTATPTVTATPTKTPTITATPTLTPVLFTISGNAGVPWAILRYYDGSLKTVRADASGNYTLGVSYNWSGTITPVRQGYTFNPASSSYSNVWYNQPPKNYTATFVGLISAGGQDTCWLKSDHSIACWGSNAHTWYTEIGQLSNGVTQVSVGNFHVCSITNNSISVNGMVNCWGMYTQNIPQSNQTFIDVNAAATHGSHTCGIKADNTVTCWGQIPYNEDAVPNATFLQISGGQNFTCGIKTDNTVTCWGGSNYYGQNTPPSSSFTQIAAGNYFACGIKGDNTVACWGENTYLQAMPPTGTFTQITAGLEHACGIKSDGIVTCWGRNIYGESTPPSNITFTQITAGASHTCGLMTNGALTCWGRNDPDQSNPIRIYGNTGIPSVTLSYTDAVAKTVTSGTYGHYSIDLPYGWSGIVVPSKNGYVFSPASKSYSNLTQDVQSSENYTAATPTPTPTLTKTPTPTPITITFASVADEDGWVLESSTTPNTGGSTDSDDSALRVGDNASNQEYRSILSFETGAAIPDNATIVSATLRIKQASIVGENLLETRSLHFDIAEGKYGTGYALQNMDFEATPSPEGANSVAYIMTNSTPDANNWYTISLNATARSYISLTGSSKTQFRLHFGTLTNNSIANYIRFYSSNASGGYPQLIISYTVP